MASIRIEARSFVLRLLALHTIVCLTQSMARVRKSARYRSAAWRQSAQVSSYIKSPLKNSGAVPGGSMNIMIERIGEQFPDISEAHIEELFNSLRSARAVFSFRAIDTTDLPVSDGGTSLDSTDFQISEPAEMRMFGIRLQLHHPLPDITRLVRDATSSAKESTGHVPPSGSLPGTTTARVIAIFARSSWPLVHVVTAARATFEIRWRFSRRFFFPLPKTASRGGSSIIFEMSWDSAVSDRPPIQESPYQIAVKARTVGHHEPIFCVSSERPSSLIHLLMPSTTLK